MNRTPASVAHLRFLIDSLDEAVRVTVGRSLREVVCDVLVRTNRERARRPGCGGPWLVCMMAFGLLEGLGCNGLPNQRACEAAPPVRSLPSRRVGGSLGGWRQAGWVTTVVDPDAARAALRSRELAYPQPGCGR